MGAEPAGAWDQARGCSSGTAGDPSALPSCFPILCHSAISPTRPRRPWTLEPALALTLKASCSRSTMLDESSCRTPSEETGKYDDSHVQISRERVQVLGQPHMPQKHNSLCDLPTHLKQSSTDPVTSSASSLGSLPAILPILNRKSSVSICQHHQPVEGPCYTRNITRDCPSLQRRAKWLSVFHKGHLPHQGAHHTDMNTGQISGGPRQRGPTGHVFVSDSQGS